jgi:hypothetical protein
MGKGEKRPSPDLCNKAPPTCTREHHNLGPKFDYAHAMLAILKNAMLPFVILHGLNLLSK